MLATADPGWKGDGMRWLCFLVALLVATTQSPLRADTLYERVRPAIEKAVSFFHGNASTHGGYVYLYSADFSLSEAEGIPGPDTFWIQPPGTPAVGEAFLDAYAATQSPAAKLAAMDAARALVHTQLHSGGWYYGASMGDQGRSEFSYRRNLDRELVPDPTPEAEQTGEGGWEAWRKRRFESNMTIYDDDVTQSALRFLLRSHYVFGDEEPAIRECVEHGLEAVLGTQYPNGAWSPNFDRFPKAGGPSESLYPVEKAAFPESWSRTWTKDFAGCYSTNDELHSNQIETLIVAWKVLKDTRYLDAAKRAGEFLILAQMPDPQPAWAQAYGREMHPVWDRAFEPPAITSRESQRNLRALLDLYRVTADRRFLEPIPKALAYFEGSLLPDGRLSRYYEMKTNRPIYFERGEGGQGWSLTYEDDRLASNYAFKIESELDSIRAEYVRLLKDPKAPKPQKAPTKERVLEILGAMGENGAWAEDGVVRNAEGKKTAPHGGVIKSSTFAMNIAALSRYLKSK